MSLQKILILVVGLLLTRYTIVSCQDKLPITQLGIQKEYGEALEAVFGMGIRLQVILEDPKAPNDKNFVISPLSATIVMAQLMLGADGEFRDQLYYLLSLTNKKEDKYMSLNISEGLQSSMYLVPYAKLHVQLGNLLKALRPNSDINKTFTLEEASALFVDNSVLLNKSFEHQLQVIYKTKIQNVNFVGDPVGVQKIINDWASAHTKGLIKKILHKPPMATTAAVLANAIYFYGDWENPFSNEFNRQGIFNVNANKNVSVTYMIELMEEVLYNENSDYTVICLPYKNKTLGMYILMPNPKGPFLYNIRGFVENLKMNDMLDTIAAAKIRSVMVKIPKMSLSSSVSLLEPLQKFKIYKKQTKNTIPLGNRINDLVEHLEDKVSAFSAFNTTNYGNIELRAAAQNQPLQISGILQQTTISINEKGTEAAVVTATVVDRITANKRFAVERPFVFFIRHEPTSAILFWGAIVDPTQSGT